MSNLPITATATLVRHVLRTRFPSTKFSVRCHRGTTSAAIRVSWIDGPTETEITPLLAAHESDTTYLFVHREMSAGFLAVVEAEVRRRLATCTQDDPSEVWVTGEDRPTHVGDSLATVAIRAGRDAGFVNAAFAR